MADEDAGQEERVLHRLNRRMAWLGIVAGLVGALVGCGGTVLGAVLTNAASSEQARHEFMQEQRMAAYTDLIGAIDADREAMNAVLVDVYWRLGPKQIDDSAYHGAHSDAWEASQVALSHAATRVLMVGSHQETSLAQKAWTLSVSARNTYTQERTDTGVEELKTRLNRAITENRGAFVQTAIEEIQR